MTRSSSAAVPDAVAQLSDRGLAGPRRKASSSAISDPEFVFETDGSAPSHYLKSIQALPAHFARR
jgi:hypothetical protein